MYKLARKYNGKAVFLFCNMDGPGAAAKYVRQKGLPNDGLLQHVDGSGNSQAYQIRYAAHKSLFNKEGRIASNGVFNLEAELKKVI